MNPEEFVQIRDPFVAIRVNDEESHTNVHEFAPLTRMDTNPARMDTNLLGGWALGTDASGGGTADGR